jgi:hypothetical protein
VSGREEESMRIMTILCIATVFVPFCGCSPPPVPSGNTQSQNTSSDADAKPVASVQMYPILKYSRGQGSDVLLQHEANDAEKQLFTKMDSAVVAIEGDPSLEQCHAIVVPIGRDAGLNAEQSVAFWTRMTFSEFEP